jgi:hypothetical protein
MSMRANESFGRSPWAAVLNPNCAQCRGTGWREAGSVCLCVWRGVFRDCYSRFRDCIIRSGTNIKSIRWDSIPGPKGRRALYSRKQEEYIADFCLVAKRVLEPAEYSLFRFHFLLGADWKLCCRQLHMERGNFFHAVYRIEQKLGEVFATLKPLTLFPSDEYFGSNRQVDIRPFPLPAPRYTNGLPLRPPLAEAIPEPEPLPVEVTGLVIVATAHPPFDGTDATARATWIRKQMRSGYTLRRIANTLNRWGIRPPVFAASPTIIKRAIPDQGHWTEVTVKMELLAAPVTPKRVYQRRAA